MSLLRTTLNRVKIITLIVMALTISFQHQAYAQRIKLDISSSNFEPMPIAIPSFISVTPTLRDVGASMSEVISNDLRRSGIFAPLQPKSFIEKLSDFSVSPQFTNWRPINAQALIQGQATQMSDGRMKVEFRLWDVSTGKQIIGQQYISEKDNWRRISHIIADAVHKAFTGESGFFDSRIVFVEETGAKDDRKKRLAIMDQDGANLKYLTRGGDLVLTPRFNPKRDEITYMSYSQGQPRIYLLNIETGQRELVGKFPSMTFSPRFSPDGQKVVLSLQQDGNANLYTFDVRNGRTTRLSNSPSIDTSPSYSPDASQIVFESDRGGTQQIYVMSASGGTAKRISFGNGRYGTPVWSPRGDLIAFTKQSENRFMIGVMKPDGSGERILSEGYQLEGPTWAPNGRALMFFREIPGAKGGPKIWMTDITGRILEEVKTSNFASDPSWSALRN